MNTEIKTYEDACKALNLNPNALPDVSKMPEKHRKALISHFKLIIITEALNEGWTPNWNDMNELKYQPWFEIKATKKQPSGVGFSGSGYGFWRTFTFCGSRLCFKSRELCLYAVKQFEELYKDYYLL